jgi:hypothetical protein
MNYASIVLFLYKNLINKTMKMKFERVNEKREKEIYSKLLKKWVSEEEFAKHVAIVKAIIQNILSKK